MRAGPRYHSSEGASLLLGDGFRSENCGKSKVGDLT
jgi:hypothetical protein